MNLSSIILGPVITEKAMKLAEKNHHTLFVSSAATKLDIQAALRKFFGVSPISLSIIKMPKKIRVRGTRGPVVKRKPRVKVLFRLPQGQSFDLLQMKTSPEKPKKKSASSSDSQ